VDYRIWVVLQELVCQQRVQDVDELKQCLIDSWSSIQQAIIDQAIDQWRVRRRACIWREADILNSCSDVLVLHCLSVLFATDVSFNICDVTGIGYRHVCRISQGLIPVSFKRYSCD